MSRPNRLAVEHLGDAVLGLGVAAPRLSWWLPEGCSAQVAYEVRGDGWTSGRVESDRSVLVAWPGPALASRQRVSWQVRVWTDAGSKSDWSAPAWFELGLLDPSDWVAEWIAPPGKPTEGAVGVLRREFTLERSAEPLEGRLYATALGLYEVFLNGTRVGDRELTPGFTQYQTRLQTQAYDVTGLVRPGDNVVEVMLADGWYRGQIGITRATNQWGDRTAFLGQLELTGADGTRTVITTDDAWTAGAGPVETADLIAGERWDLRNVPRDWQPVAVVPAPTAELVDSPAPPVRRVEELSPVSVRRLDGDRQLVDFGQNLNGWTRLTNLGPGGTTTRLVHGEWLDGSGDLTTEHLRPAVPMLPEPRPAGQIDEVVSAGVPGESFEPRRTTHGFRYVRVEGRSDDLTADDLTALVVHTDLRRTGWFACSDPSVNALHEAATWSFRDNACDIPTDCPHRERAGWTADWALFLPSAAYLYDVAGFSVKWLRDLAADQWPDGTIANMSPCAPAEGRQSPAAFLNGSAGWEDAAVIVPWELYRAYGDTAVLAEFWPTMTRWMDKVERTAGEDLLRRTGFHWGEWLVPGEDISDFGAFVAADKGDVATAYFAHSTGLLARVAAVLGDRSAAERYRTLSERVRAAWQQAYVVDGRLVPDTQANLVRALAFDLVPAALRAAVADRLVELIRAADTHLATGFLATPYLLPVLADAGHLDVAYELLFSGSEPSWLTMIGRGATTVWERWDGVSADGVPRESLNHYSKGAVISFLHRYVAGLQLVEPMYRRFRVQPRPGGGLTWANARFESPYGPIEVAWTLDADELQLTVEVPPGTVAEVVLPDGTRTDASPGRHAFRSPV